MFTYASFFSGAGGFDLGFDRAGFECVLQVEKDKYARRVLERHYPNVPKLEDVRDVTRESAPTSAAANVFIGGFPCQNVSMAGKRDGLAGEQSGLYFEFHRIITEFRPEWVVIENVPGLLSSNGGRDFAAVVGGLTGVLPNVPKGGWGNAGIFRGRRGLYNVTYRVLDSQYFGVPQRRRRVFIVGHLTTGRGRVTNVLFERESLSRHSPPRREAGETIATRVRINPKIAGTLAASGAGTARPAGQKNEPDFLITQPRTYRKQAHGAFSESTSATTLKARDTKSADTLIAVAVDTRNDAISQCVSGTLQAKPNGGYSLNYINPIAFINAGESAGSVGASDTVSPTLRGSSSGCQMPYVGTGQVVRRLTPMECERLQGFPDNFTAGESDHQRYKQMGNAVTVNVAQWIAQRIRMEAS
jgi:DNA (cytosine-5)-methyltransferase 1